MMKSPTNITPISLMTHNRGYGLARFRTQYALAVIAHMQQPPSAAGTEGSPIGIRIADAPLVRGVVGDIFDDERAALLG
jgi:hypothetical protein